MILWKNRRNRTLDSLNVDISMDSPACLVLSNLDFALKSGIDNSEATV